MTRLGCVPFVVPFASSGAPSNRRRDAASGQFHQMTDPVVWCCASVRRELGGCG